MPSVVNKSLLASLGIVQLTYEKAERLAKDLTKRGILAKEKQYIFIEGLINKAKKNTAELDKKAKETIKELISRGEFLGDVARLKRVDAGVEIKDKVKKIIKNVINKSKSAKEKVKEQKKSLDKLVDIKVEETLKKLNIPTKKEIDEIKNKLDELIKKTEEKGNQDEYIQ